MTVLGVNELIARFARTALVAEAGVKVAEEEVKVTIRDEAQAQVAVLTGETQQSIEITSEGVQAGGAALYLEFGTSFMPAQPFMRPAVDAAEGASAKIEAELAAVITRA